MKWSMIFCSNEVEKSAQGQTKQSTRNINSGGGGRQRLGWEASSVANDSIQRMFR